MFLIVGLGNPGKEYEGTRHNVGREALERFANATCDPRTWSTRTSLHAEILESEAVGHRIILAKPTTYMNESGKSVSALVKKFQIPDSKFQILVLHDDLDLPVGALRLSSGGSSGGQKGVQSIIDALARSPSVSPPLSEGEREGVRQAGTDFLRLRIGIGPNATPDGHRIPAEKFVLEKFRAEERPIIDAAIQRAAEVISIFLRDGLAVAQRCTH